MSVNTYSPSFQKHRKRVIRIKITEIKIRAKSIVEKIYKLNCDYKIIMDTFYDKQYMFIWVNTLSSISNSKSPLFFLITIR